MGLKTIGLRRSSQVMEIVNCFNTFLVHFEQ